MKKILKKVLFAGLFAFLIASPVAVIATPQTTYAADPGNCETRFLGIPPWYRGLTKTDSNVDGTNNCTIMSPEEVSPGSKDALSIFIWKIVLNVIEMALILAGWIALGFILYGGFLFITSGGNASQVEKARKSILNAVIGLVISIGAIVISNLAFSLLSDTATVNDYGVREINADDLVLTIVNFVYYIAGIVAVIVIIIAGITYSTSIGDASRIVRAKSMILYSVIGLVVMLAAFAITNFVMSSF